jgi:cytochrome P450
MMGVAPSYVASKAYKARKILQKAWLPYYAAGLYKNASAIVRGRREAALKWGIPESEVQRWEYVMFYAPTTNSGPTAYWLLSYILADPELLEDIREEISRITTMSTVKGIKKVSFDITRIQKECPLLVAAWEESFRLSAATVSVRMVMEDTMLTDKYLLKKGAVIQMPSAPSSQSEAIWGPNPDKFNAKRMLKSTYDALSREDRKTRTQAYFPWGGGKYICPGKNFATTELIGIVGSFLYGFDVKTSNGEKLKTPLPGKRQIGRNVDLPIKDIEVIIKRREEFEGVQFAYFVGNGVEV